MSQDEQAVNEQGAAITPTESAAVETTQHMDDPLGDDAFDDIDDEVAETETVEPKPEPQAQEQKPEEPETNPIEGEQKPLAPKSENRFQQLANENKRLKEELERNKLRDSQLASEQQLLGEVNPETGDYYSPAEIERIAYEQRIQAERESVSQERYSLEVQHNQQVIQSETVQALQDFPIFDSNSPEFKPELAKQLDAMLANVLIMDENQQIIGAHVSPYQLSKTIADAAKLSATQGQAEAQRATERMLANVDDTGSGTPPPKGDSDMDDFDNAWDS